MSAVDTSDWEELSPADCARMDAIRKPIEDVVGANINDKAGLVVHALTETLARVITACGMYGKHDRFTYLAAVQKALPKMVELAHEAVRPKGSN